MGYLLAGLLAELLVKWVYRKVLNCSVKIKGKPVVSVWSFLPCSIRDGNPINSSKSEEIRA